MLPSPMACRPAGRCLRKVVVCVVTTLGLPALAAAQQNRIPARITQPIDTTNLTRLKGNVHPLARAQFDRGPAPASLQLNRMLLVLKPSADQEAALEELLDQQQDTSSPNYHAWLTPEQFGKEFGPADADVQKIVDWLESQGFQVQGVANGRGVVEFSGSAGQVENAFHAGIHRYAINGESHWANATDPQIPAALAPVVAGVASLNDFRKQPMYRLAGVFAKSKETSQVKAVKAVAGAPAPNFTQACGTNPNNGQTEYCYAVGPYDFATIYNVLPLWNAAPAIDGTGESIAIVARTNINPQDISDFQVLFGLPANPPQVILDGPDPGIVSGDETESDLDVEWSGAVAKGAAIKLVVSESTETSDGVDLSALYIVDNDLAPIMSESYGECELGLGTAGNQFTNNLWRQAAAEGITVFVSSGDDGSAGCDFYDGNAPEAAQYGLQVSGLASTPYNVAVGGTDFDDFSNPTAYWNSTNTSLQESAKGYIPETTWNSSCTNAIFAQIGFSSNAETNCNNAQLSPFVITLGASGGKSACTASSSPTTSACSGGYAKPSWQTGTGVPADGKRDVPDVSLFASNGFVGNFYMMCERDVSYGPCSTSNFLGVGGTSASTPAFAGLLALVDQKTAARQGNANYIFYKLASKAGSTCTSAANPASTCVFYDIPAGSTIAMPCRQGSANCSPSSGHAYGVLPGYATTTGYDLATGLGTVNANNLVNQWGSVGSTPSTTTLTLNDGNPVSITHGTAVPVSVSVAPNSPLPTGNVALEATQNGNTTDFGTLTLSGGTASGSVSTLPGGASYSVQAHYAGDATYQGSDSNAVTVSVNPEASKTSVGIITFNFARQVTGTNATSFPYGSFYLLRSDVTNGTGTSCFSGTSKSTVYPCPTGTLTLTDNASPLDSGTFPLNSQGYAEDQPIQLTGGTHNLVASYGGDSSYNASTGTASVTVTPAATTTEITSPSSSTPPPSAIIGQTLSVNELTQATSSGLAPTGTYTVFDGSSALSTISSLSYGSTNPSAEQVSLTGFVLTTLAAPSGPHSLSVHYSGDANYASSVSGSITVNAVYADNLTVSATPNNVIYGQNTNVTVTATLSTTNPASNASLKPTGALTFTPSLGTIGGAVSTTTGPDSNGNWMVQASVTVTPQQTESIAANFAGDSNYAAASQSAFVTVTVPDFTISAGSGTLTISAGQTGTATLTITPSTNYSSTVALSCNGLAFLGETCTISPSSVTLSNGSPATATVSIATLAPSASLTAQSAPDRPHGIPPGWRERGPWLGVATVAGLVAFGLLMLDSGRRFRRLALVLGFLCVFTFAVGCGGGGGGGTGGSGGDGGGGGSGQTVPVPTTTALSTSSTKLAAGSTADLVATITSTATPITGILQFNVGKTPGLLGDVSLASGTAQAQLSDPSPWGPGTYAVSASYSGDIHNAASQSGTINVVVTGTALQGVLAQTSSDVRGVSVNVAIQ
jgi:subtilase family serine protease